MLGRFWWDEGEAEENEVSEFLPRGVTCAAECLVERGTRDFFFHKRWDDYAHRESRYGHGIVCMIQPSKTASVGVTTPTGMLRTQATRAMSYFSRVGGVERSPAGLLLAKICAISSSLFTVEAAERYARVGWRFVSGGLCR